jgi:hypothetical protein
MRDKKFKLKKYSSVLSNAFAIAERVVQDVVRVGMAGILAIQNVFLT